MTSKRDLWVLYGGPKPRRISEILSYAEAGSTPERLAPGWKGSPRPYRYTVVEVRLSNQKVTRVPLGHVVYATRAEVLDMLTRPYGAPVRQLP